MRLRAGEKWHEQGLVFCNRHGRFLFPEVVLKHPTSTYIDQELAQYRSSRGIALVHQ
jgi:hypothetical protein